MSARRRSLVVEREAELAWVRPALHFPSPYGLSSCRLVRHCVFDEPLDPNWERPWDHGDLLRSMRTAASAPPHLADKAQHVIEQYRSWMEPRYLELADAEIAKAATT